MIIEVPYGYEVTGTLKGKRNPESVCLADVMQVEIAEISGDAAPVVVLLDSPDRERTDLGFEVEFRSHDGQLFREAVGYDTANERRDVRITPDRMIEAVTARRTIENFYPFPRPDYAWERTKPVADVAFREVQANARDAMRAKVAKAAADLRIIDGRLFKASAEPVLELVFDRDETRIRTLLAPAEPDGSKNYARLDRGHTLVSLSRWVDARPELAAKLEAALPNVLRPELLAYDDEGVIFRYQVNRYLEFWPRHLETMSKASLMAYADVRDAIADLKAGKRDLQDMIEPLQAAIAAQRAEDFMTDSAKRMEGSIKRWMEARSDDVALGMALG